MLPKQINLSPDIKKLRDQGYEVSIQGAYLIISNIPYVNKDKKILFGTLLTDLSIAGGKVVKPTFHTVLFAGEYPCNIDGSPIKQIEHGSKVQKVVGEITSNHSFSNKPRGGYLDYFHKMTQYINIIANPAMAIDNNVTPRTFKVVENLVEDTNLNYPDTNSSRANIIAISDKIKNQKIGIIGLGGTGSYILDFLSKTSVAQIQLFDGDQYLLHNAFRSPGAPSVDELNAKPFKVEYFKNKYEKMHNGIVANPIFIDSENITKVKGLDFVFICIDKSAIKKSLFAFLIKNGIPFIDVGMGVETVENSLLGMVRVTACTSDATDHIINGNRVSLSDADIEDEYHTNIQIAELNALNAVYAIIKWKKLFGFYHDHEKEYNSTYSINVNSIVNEDNAA